MVAEPVQDLFARPTEGDDHSWEPTDSGLPGLTREAVALYRYVVAHPRWTHADVTSITGLSEREIDDAVRALRSSRLLRPSLDPERVWDPVRPEAALVDLLGAEEARLQREQETVTKVRDALLSLQPTYLDALQRRSPREWIDEWRGRDGAVPTVLARHVHRAAADLCVANPDGETDWLDCLHVYGAGSSPRTAGDRSIRLALNHAVRRDPRVRRQMTVLHERDTQVRTAESVPVRMVLIDRRTAILPLADVSPGMPVTESHAEDGVAVVRHPAVVHALASVFEEMWATARPFPDRPCTNGITDDPVHRHILQLLTAGHKDEVVARRVGLSVRTCRRYIADIMDELGAVSRFQAGVLAQRKLLDAS